MAIKDWKKLTSSKNGLTFWNKKKDWTIHVNKVYLEKKWYVNEERGHINTTYFKNKSQALKYAKAYMRKH